MAAGQGAGGPEERAVKRWNRQAEKLRRALSTVRETDVYLGKIEGLRSSVSEPAHGSSRLTRMCLRQIDAVEDRMKRDRKEAARKAVDEIKRRMGRFERLSSELEAELRDAVDGRANSEAGGVGEMIAGLLTESSNLNAENLHEFRKRVKNVRYVAEIAGTGMRGRPGSWRLSDECNRPQVCGTIGRRWQKGQAARFAAATKRAASENCWRHWPVNPCRRLSRFAGAPQGDWRKSAQGPRRL